MDTDFILGIIFGVGFTTIIFLIYLIKKNEIDERNKYMIGLNDEQYREYNEFLKRID